MELREAADKQSGADEQNERERDLRDHEPAADKPFAGFRSAAPKPAFERFVDVGFGQAPRRRDPGEKTRDEADRAREGENASINIHFADARQLLSDRAHDRAEAGPRGDQADGGARDPEEHAFDQQLLNDLTTARPERRTHRDLSRAPERPREKQVREIGARNEQDERN